MKVKVGICGAWVEVSLTANNANGREYFWLVIDAEFGAGDEGPSELADGGWVFGFDEIHGAGFFKLVG